MRGKKDKIEAEMGGGRAYNVCKTIADFVAFTGFDAAVLYLGTEGKQELHTRYK